MPSTEKSFSSTSGLIHASNVSAPSAHDWHNTYKGAGYDVICIHSVESTLEKDQRNGKSEAADLDITYPFVLRNNLSTWTTYRNGY